MEVRSINAIHINSTAPFFARKGKDASYSIAPYDLYMTALSALLWRRLNGRIDMLTDETAAEFYEKNGLTPLWDEVRVVLDASLGGIDPEMFWAGGKLLALACVEAPVVMIDTDFIVWKKLELSDKIVCAHRENLMPDVYPDVSVFRNNSIEINPAYNRAALPCNTAFLYLPDNDIKEFYTSQSIAFMRTAEKSDDCLCNMVFAEQRLLAMCADYLGVEIETLLDKDRLFIPQKDYSHLWGAKRVLQKNDKEKREFCERAYERLKKEFPEYSDIADGIRRLEEKQ